MNNVDKFLKDGVKEEFIKAINEELDYAGNQFNIEKFLNEQVKPILSEDERVILKNIDLQNFKAIGRQDGYLYLRYSSYCYEYEETDIKSLTFWYMYHELFQFIKDGEEYEIRELLGE